MHNKLKDHLFSLSFQKTSGGGRDSTGLPFPSRPKLKPKCHQPGINLNTSYPFFPALPWTSPLSLPHFFYVLPSVIFAPPVQNTPSFTPPKTKPQTKAHRSQDRCALVLNKRSTRSPPSSTHVLTPHIKKMANCKMQSGCTALVTYLCRTAKLFWLSSSLSNTLRSKRLSYYLTLLNPRCANIWPIVCEGGQKFLWSLDAWTLCV